MILTFLLLLVQAVSAVPPPVVYGPTDHYVVAVFPQGLAPPAAPLTLLSPLSPADLTCDRPPSADQLVLMALLEPALPRLEFADPDRPGRACVTAAIPIPAGALPDCTTAPCPLYDLFLQSVNSTGTAWSEAARPSFSLRAMPVVPPPLVRPECVGPLGNRAVSIFPTGITGTNGRAGARAIQGFQLASPNSPIVEVALRIDGVVVEPVARGEDLTGMPGWWITLPARGTHTLTVQATNDAGCTREVAARPLVVP